MKRKAMKIWLLVILLLGMSSCGIQAPTGHSQGPDLVVPVVGRTATVRVDRGDVLEFAVLPGMVRMESEALFFEIDGFTFDAFHVFPGETVTKGQLLATLHIPERRRELIEQQEAHIARLYRAHALTARHWAIDLETMNLQYIERMNAAADNFDIAAMEDAQRLYLEMDHTRLLHEQEAAWQRIERAEAYARLEELREDLHGTEIRAPYDGVVTYIAPLNHGAPIRLTTRILYMAPADAPLIVEYTGELLPNRQRVTDIEGEINGERITLTYQPLTREEVAYYSLHDLPRRTRFTLPEGSDFPLGAAVRIFAYTAYIQDALRIPVTAVVGRGITAYVYRMENGNWIPVYPTFGARTPVYVEILDGLEEGDELLVH